MLSSVVRRPLQVSSSRRSSVQSVRKALDGITQALKTHDVTVHELTQPGGRRSVEYACGGVVACWHEDVRGEHELKWVWGLYLSHEQSALIEAHAGIYAAVR